MRSLNEELKQLYSSKIKGLKKIDAECFQYLDGPLLMQCDEKLWNDAKYKILIIGQESDWNGTTSHDVESLLESYIKDKIKKSIFWQGAHFFNDILNPQFKNQRCFLWTNVTKYSRSKSPLTQEDIIYTLKHFNVLKKEIELIKPNVVLFFSGKNYDDIIKQQFNKGDLEFNKISDEYGEHEIAQIVSASHSLPIHSYRTYHPRYLRQQKKWHYLSVLAAKIHGVEIKKVLQIQLGDDYVVDDSFGAKNTGITYNTPTHKKFSIRFEFERDMKDFFYGICAKHQHTTKNNRNKITNFLKDSEPQNESWPYWKWFEHRDWNAETFNDIQNGKLAKKIKQTVSTIKEKTEEMQILF